MGVWITFFLGFDLLGWWQGNLFLPKDRLFGRLLDLTLLLLAPLIFKAFKARLIMQRIPRARKISMKIGEGTTDENRSPSSNPYLRKSFEGRKCVSNGFFSLLIGKEKQKFQCLRKCEKRNPMKYQTFLGYLSMVKQFYSGDEI